MPPRDKFLIKGFLASMDSNPPILLPFRFNPSTINDVKETNWVEHKIPGLPYAKYHWTGGGTRNISFELFLDGFETPTAIAGVYGLTAGIHADIASLERFLYPKDGKSPNAAIAKITGGSGSTNTPNLVNAASSLISANTKRQFVKPPIAIFGYGSFVANVIVRKAEINVEKWNNFLDPVRAKANVTLSVLEDTSLDSAQKYLRKIRSTAGAFGAPVTFLGG